MRTLLFSGRRFELVGHTAPVTSVAFSCDCTLLTASSDGTVRVWDLQIESCSRVFRKIGLLITGSLSTGVYLRPLEIVLIDHTYAQVSQFIAISGGQISPNSVTAMLVIEPRRLLLTTTEGILFWDPDNDWISSATRIRGNDVVASLTCIVQNGSIV